MTADQVGRAIHASQVREIPQRWAGTFILPSSGRQVQLAVPADLTPREAIEIVAFVTTQLPNEIAKALQQGPRPLLVATG